MEKRQDRVSAQAAPSSGSLQMLPHPRHGRRAEAAARSHVPVGSQGAVAQHGSQCLMLQGWVFELRPCSRHSGHLQAIRPHQFNTHDSRSHSQHCTSLSEGFLWCYRHFTPPMRQKNSMSWQSSYQSMMDGS